MDYQQIWISIARSTALSYAEKLVRLQSYLPSEEGLIQKNLEASIPSGRIAQKQHRAVQEVKQNAEQRWLRESENRILCYPDSRYPKWLREIPDPPLLLYARGNLATMQKPMLAIVGSRNPSPNGIDNARYFSSELVASGMTIVSGLAHGIDAQAHRATLAYQSSTIAIMATGADRIYPAENTDLAKNILAAGGLLLTEFPLGTPPRRENFPRRNRIISGLSRGTVVVEASIRSGSLITARLAGEQGREVFAIPGPITSGLSIGCHRLIRDGATLVQEPADILQGIRLEFSSRDHVAGVESVNREVAPCEPANLDANMEKVLANIDQSGCTIDQLIIRSGMSTADVSASLLRLELQGLIIHLDNGLIALTR